MDFDPVEFDKWLYARTNRRHLLTEMLTSEEYEWAMNLRVTRVAKLHFIYQASLAGQPVAKRIFAKMMAFRLSS